MTLRQFHDAARAFVLSLELARHDRWTRARVLRRQQRQLNRLVRHAVARSAFYRDLYRGVPLEGDVRLADLPVIDKRRMMADFDRVVTDPRLKRAELEAHLKGLDRDDYYLGEYRVLMTAGTSGLRGIFVFSRREWSVELANAIRWHGFMGVRPRLFGRTRISAIGADRPAHVSARLTESGDVGAFAFQRLPATLPFDRLVAAIDGFQPQVLLSYPSVAALLAIAQLEGRLAIHPRAISTHSERLSPEMARRIERAWGTRPFDHYGLTEISTVGVECDRHRGLHLLDDLFIAEIVDQDYRPVAPGRMGTRLLLTGLYNHTQPLIRYEVSDMLTMASEACPCGRPFPLIAEVGGRSEETVELVGQDGRPVSIPPAVLAAMIEELEEVAEFRVGAAAGLLRLDIVPTAAAARERLAARVRERLERRLVALGARPPRIDVALHERLERSGARMGKLGQIERLSGPGVLAPADDRLGSAR
jgi:phenylacetate-coenzyme A ligase PaaK-like adenylate-forming protein